MYRSKATIKDNKTDFGKTLYNVIEAYFSRGTATSNPSLFMVF